MDTVNFDIDYLQYSIKDNPMMFTDTPTYRKSPMSFYQTVAEHIGGIKVYTGNPNSEKQLVVMSGKTCEFHRERIPEIIESVIDNGGSFSRIDFSATTDNGETLAKFVDAIANNRWESRRFKSDKPKMITDEKTNVETCYVGDLKKRGKKGIFRAYNKSVELGLDIDLIRFELECKRKVADHNARRYSQGASIGSLIRNGVDLPNDKWWIDLMGSKHSQKQLNIPDDSNETDFQKRWVWLMNQVAPALGQAIFEDEQMNQNNWHSFMDKVIAEYNIHKGLNSS